MIRAINPDAKAVPLQADIVDEEVAKLIATFDFVLLCTDSHASRAGVNQAAYQYLVPVIDMGVSITIANGAVSHNDFQLAAICSNHVKPATRFQIAREQAIRCWPLTRPGHAISSHETFPASRSISGMIGMIRHRKGGIQLGPIRGERRRWVALVAAYMLVLQSLLSAFALGANAAPVLLDAFGGVICASQDTGRMPAGDGGSDHHKMPDCCDVGCVMFAPALAPRCTAESAFLQPGSENAVTFRIYAHLPLPSREESSGNPRAPPSSFRL